MVLSRTCLAFLIQSASLVSSASVVRRGDQWKNAYPKDVKRESATTAAAVWQPPMLSNYQMILTGKPDIDPDDPSVVPSNGIFEVDLFNNTADEIAQMKQLGHKVVCYFSAATAERWRSDYKDFTSDELGVEMHEWPGERYLDIRKDSVFQKISKRVRMANTKGCDAIEPDNTDVYANNNGFNPPITQADSIAYLHKVSSLARSLKLSVGIKNCLEILGSIFSAVDFAISEECVQYNNCDIYSNFTHPNITGVTGKPVFNFEYVNYTYVSADGRRTGKKEDDSPDDGGHYEIHHDCFTQTNDALRKKLCALDQPGATMQKPYDGINYAIKTLDLDGWVMWCDGKVDVTKVKDQDMRKRVSRKGSGGLRKKTVCDDAPDGSDPSLPPPRRPN